MPYRVCSKTVQQNCATIHVLGAGQTEKECHSLHAEGMKRHSWIVQTLQWQIHVPIRQEYYAVCHPGKYVPYQLSNIPPAGRDNSTCPTILVPGDSTCATCNQTCPSLWNTCN